MKQTWKLIIAVFAVLAGIASGLHTASAQDTSAPMAIISS
jgi:hypothetical protein